MLFRSMTELENLGVKPIEAVGQEFDPNFHNAVMQVESDEYEEGGRFLCLWRLGKSNVKYWALWNGGSLKGTESSMHLCMQKCTSEDCFYSYSICLLAELI